MPSASRGDSWRLRHTSSQSSAVHAISTNFGEASCGGKICPAFRLNIKSKLDFRSFLALKYCCSINAQLWFRVMRARIAPFSVFTLWWESVHGPFKVSTGYTGYISLRLSYFKTIVCLKKNIFLRNCLFKGFEECTLSLLRSLKGQVLKQILGCKKILRWSTP